MLIIWLPQDPTLSQSSSFFQTIKAPFAKDPNPSSQEVHPEVCIGPRLTLRVVCSIQRCWVSGRVLEFLVLAFMKRRREGALVASRLTQRAILGNAHGFRFCPQWTLSHSRFFTATPNKPQKKDSDWEVIIGLEVHAQIASKTKLFSGTRT